jgi:hypothetical protein
MHALRQARRAVAVFLCCTLRWPSEPDGVRRVQMPRCAAGTCWVLPQQFRVLTTTFLDWIQSTRAAMAGWRLAVSDSHHRSGQAAWPRGMKLTLLRVTKAFCTVRPSLATGAMKGRRLSNCGYICENTRPTSCFTRLDDARELSVLKHRTSR